MRFAEVFLRLGSALVAWMMIYTYFVWMAALPAMSCGPEGDKMHRVLLGVSLLALAVSLALRATRPFPDIHRLLSHLVWPLAILGLFAVKNIWTVFQRTNLDGLAICAEHAPTSLQIIWAPAQILIVIALGVSFLVLRRGTHFASH